MSRDVLVLGDQLGRGSGALARAEPGRDRIVMVEALAKLRERPWHRQKLAFVWSAMRHLAEELRAEGFEVATTRAATLREGLADLRADPERTVVMAPSSHDLRATLRRWGVEQVANDAFIAGEQAFADWAGSRRSLGLEPFYRRVRAEHGWLMDGDEPIGGTWNLDAENRERPPRGGVDAPPVEAPTEDAIDEAVRAELAELEASMGLELHGSPGPRRFAATRAEAERALTAFVDERLEGFGPLEDAVVADEPYLWHSLLSAPLNVGLLHPAEVCDAIDAAYRQRAADGAEPHLPSYEGALRQICGWREYVWGLYWWRMPAWREDNALGQTGALPSYFWDGETDMACVAGTIGDLLERAWVHHIPRLMILGNHALLAGVDPHVLNDWFHGMFVDGYEWVMLPNVVGMSQWADGGIMATKPYASGGRYLDRMTTYCGACRFDPTRRTGADACPFTTLYWDFLDRHEEPLRRNHRMRPMYGTLERLGDDERAAVRAQAADWRAAPPG